MKIQVKSSKPRTSICSLADISARTPEGQITRTACGKTSRIKIRPGPECGLVVEYYDGSGADRRLLILSLRVVKHLRVTVPYSNIRQALQYAKSEAIRIRDVTKRCGDMTSQRMPVVKIVRSPFAVLVTSRSIQAWWGVFQGGQHGLAKEEQEGGYPSPSRS